MLISLEIIISRYTSLTLDTNVESFSNDKIIEVNVNLSGLLERETLNRDLLERKKDETLINILALVKISIRELCFFTVYSMPYQIKVNGQKKISYSY